MILVAFHKEYPYSKSEIFKPIHVGKALSRVELPMISDMDGEDHISEKNKNYCELTAMYWAWKNLPLQNLPFIGFMHYRRFLNFDQTALGSFLHGFSPYEKVKKVMRTATEWSGIYNDSHGEKINHYLNTHDVLLPRKFYKKRLSPKDDFSQAHYKEDWEVFEQVIREGYPHYFPTFEKEFLKQPARVYIYHIFIMKPELFSSYMQWLFDVLSKMEGKLKAEKSSDVYQARVYGFLGERLLHLFVTHHQLKVKELQTIFIED
ncbi:DUF4422 domain-containing protein [Persicobacter diffluens]|uniref:Exopolysaccharide biosynthesis protein n=1 Tax=Persicobacter diffluens TaxID=981 RepID=A0AAN4VVM5_9BACT|nr:exopolysaccharide biosynthesis protein [Persicobacter diffluens]